MTSKDNGGPAFPQHDLSGYGIGPSMSGYDPSDEYSGRYEVTGMTLRTYAAIKLRVPESGIDWLDEMIRQAKRDWFAGHALPQAVEDYGQPELGRVTGQRRDRGNPVLPYATSNTMTREQIIARQAYRYADAMLDARK